MEVDGKRVIAEDAVYILLHKPRGVVSTMSDPEGRPTVAQDHRQRPLGEREAGAGVPGRAGSILPPAGAILATNDGAFSDAMLHPREGVPKTYVVKVSGIMEEKDIEKWRNA